MIATSAHMIQTPSHTTHHHQGGVQTKYLRQDMILMTDTAHSVTTDHKRMKNAKCEAFPPWRAEWLSLLKTTLHQNPDASPSLHQNPDVTVLFFLTGSITIFPPSAVPFFLFNDSSLGLSSGQCHTSSSPSLISCPQRTDR